MPQQTIPSAEANFSAGLKTEFTGLTFPENAVIDCNNTIFERIGNAHRRAGVDYETNYTLTTINRTTSAISSYKWNNVGGDGSTQVVVQQVGTTLHFYRSSSAATTDPLSDQKLGSTITISTYLAPGGTFDATLECQYADGNGYLFVYHPSCEPFYCTYSAGTITATVIDVRIRDFAGITETGVSDTFRPTTLTDPHAYNLYNQGWVSNPSWTANSTTSQATTTGSHTWTIQTGLTITGGTPVTVTAVGAGASGTNITETGTVTSYNSGTGSLVLNITSTSLSGITWAVWTFQSLNTGRRDTWFAATGNYPANSDVWWLFKNTTNVFDPTTTISNVTLNAGPAPKGYFIMNVFNQNRAVVSGLPNLGNSITTTVRPRTGTWFQGRVWYAGVDAQNYSEKLYFSQIIENVDQFGKCYQINDPTSEDSFDLLPTDGGVVKIQGCGAIYKLFPIQNGLLVFCANGIWFITGSQGIGFAANDYTISKISAIQSISGTSFVDVRGLPMWWNEEGIYAVTLGQNDQPYGAGRAYGGGGLQVEPLTYATIQSFYQDIPLQSKKYVHGTYDPLDWVVKWTFKSTVETTVTNRYEFDRVLVYNTTTQAFYPYTVTGDVKIHGVIYVQGPGGSTSPEPAVKYITSISNGGSYSFTFSEEKDITNWADWFTTSPGGDFAYTSYFITGYRIKGAAQHKEQLNYIYVFSNNEVNTSYKMQGIWDYAIAGTSGKFTNLQLTEIDTDTDDFNVVFRRHRIRGRGLVLQYKITSQEGEPFDIIGWSIDNRVNTGL